MCLGLLLALALGSPTPAAADLGAAKKKARQAIRTWSISPKVSIGMAGVYQVHPDGRPTGDQQGKLFWIKGTSIGTVRKQHLDQTCMEEGKWYRKGKSALAFLDFEVHRKEVQLNFFTCARFKIQYGRAVTAKDLEPAALARALSGYFDVSGPDLKRPSSAIAQLERAARNATSAASTSTTRPSPRGPNPFAPSTATLTTETSTITSLTVEARPRSVRHGETVELMLHFELSGPPGAATLTETHSLFFQSQSLPNYPMTRQTQRSSGKYETVVPQQIPGQAVPGTYKFKGEICIADDCRSKAVTFQVLP